MDILMYYDGTNFDIPSVAAYTMRKNSGFKDARYILYTPNDASAEHKYLVKVFDSVLKPLPEVHALNEVPWDIFQKHVAIDNESEKRARACWSKFFTFLYHPCEDVVFLTDCDIVCIRSYLDAIPDATKKCTAVRKYYNSNMTSGALCVKNTNFTEKDVNFCKNIFFEGNEQIKKLTCCNDDIGYCSYTLAFPETVNWLEPTWRTVNPLLPISKTCEIHFTGIKPWDQEYISRYGMFWFEARNEMYKELG